MAMNRIAASFFSVFLVPFLLHGDPLLESTCKIPYDRIYLIAMNERHAKRPIGYPYLISINNKREARVLKNALPKLFIDNRTIDCKNKELCTKITEELIKKGYTNIDLGALDLSLSY